MAAEAARDGLVDRHLNRRLSRVLTPLFLRTRLTPNAITLIALAIGLLAAAAFASGGWTAGVAGALLLQLSIVVDCCDGEVARARGLQSAFGDALDVVADNVVHLCVVAAIAWAHHVATTSSLPLVLGAIAVFGMAIDFAVVWRLRVRLARGAHPPGVERLLALVANRDFSALILGLALVARLHWVLWPVAIGSHLFWVVLLARSRAFVGPSGGRPRR